MMLNPTDEQLAFKAEVRRFLERSFPLSRTRALLEKPGEGHDPAAWEGLARLGALGLLVPSEHGGADAGITEAAFVAEEMGRVLLPSPFLSSAVLAARLLVLLGDEEANAAHLPGIASGRTVATVAFMDDHGRWDPARVEARAEPSPTGWRLRGAVPFVTDATAGLLLVPAITPSGLGVFAVEGADAGVTELDCLDPTQPLAQLDLDGVPGTEIRAAADVETAMREAVHAAIACVTAAQLGGAERCLEMTVEYAKTRVQFGRPIGSYQAIKHKCADMYTRVQCARSAVHGLLEAMRTSSPDAADAARLAKAFCSDAYFRCASDTVQVHGGIGFTWEHDAHLYFKRAKASAHLLGDAVHHRAELARSLAV
jgi:alkylation response protein AidB-like acyl-CoA dehydrogenase